MNMAEEEETITIQKEDNIEQVNNVNQLWEETLGANVEDTTITVAQEEAVPDYELVFDEDSIYETELEQSLLRRLPIYQQNRAAVQRRVSDDVRTWLELNRTARAQMSMGSRKDNLFQSLRNNKWDIPWLLPVVLDKSNLYYTNDDEENWRPGTEAERVEQFEPKPNQPPIDPRSYHLVEMAELFETRDKIEEQYRNREIKYDVYKRRLWELSVINESIINPDANPQEPVLGNRVQMEVDGDALRYWNLLEPTWSGTRFQAPLIEKVDVKDASGKWLKTIEKNLENGTSAQIVAIARLPTTGITGSNTKGDLRFLWNAQGGEGMPSQSMMRIRSKITKIETGENAIITAPNHGLRTGSHIRLFQTNCVPNIDGVYSTKVSVIDADRFSVGVQLGEGSKPGDQGLLISHGAIPWVQFQWNGETKKWTYIPKEGEETEPGSPLETFDKPTLLWAGAGMTQQSKWDEFLAESIPKPIDILNHERSKLVKTISIDDWKNYLAKYHFQWHDVPYPLWKSWYESVIQEMNPNLVNITLNVKQAPVENNQEGGENIVVNQKQIKNTIQTLEKQIIQHRTAIQQIEKFEEILEKDKAKEKPEESEICVKTFVKEYEDLKELERDDTIYETGQLAKVGDKVYEWNNGWKLDMIRSNFYQMCELPGEVIQNKSWGQALECAYESSCMPRTEEILKGAKSRLENELKDFEKVLKNLQEPVKPVEEPKIYPDIQTGGNESSKEGTKVEEENYDPRVIEIKKSTKDHELRAEKMMVLFQSEGLKIGCRIISLSSQQVLGCIHEYDLYQANHVTDPAYVDDAYKEFVGTYGVPEGAYMVCKFCGAALSDIEADSYEGFSKKSGNLRESRSIWEKTDAQVIREAREASTSVPIDKQTLTTSVFSIEKELPITTDPEFRTEWVQQGGNITELDDAREIAETIHFVMNTIDLSSQLDAQGFWDSIKNILIWSRNLPSYSSYASKLRAQLQKQGISVANLREEVIQDRYLRDITGRKKMALLSQLQVWITTTFPLPTPRPIGDFQSTFEGWDNAVLFWLHMGIEFGWDPDSMRKMGTELVPFRVGTPEFQRSIERLSPRFTNAVKEFEEYPNMIQRRKVYNLAAKRAQTDGKAMIDDGPFAGMDEKMVVLNRRAEGPDDLVPEWGEMWLDPESPEEVDELRAVGLELQNKILAEFQLDWLKAPELEETFEVKDISREKFAWYHWQKRTQIVKLNRFLDLRPLPNIPFLYQTTAMNLRIKIGYGEYRLKEIDQTKEVEFLRILGTTVIMEGPQLGEQHEYTPDKVDILTGKTLKEIEKNVPTHEQFMRYEEKLSKDTKQQLENAMKVDLMREKPSEGAWSYRSREDWMKLGENGWLEGAQRAWDNFIVKMTEWKRPDDKIAFQRKMVSLIGKYLSGDQREYEMAQSLVAPTEVVVVEKKKKRTGIPAELRPEMLPPISKGSKRLFTADKEEKEEEEEEEQVLWRPTVDEITVEELERRTREIQQLIFTGFKRSQRTAVSQVNLYQQINLDKFRTPDQRSFLKEITEQQWSWLLPYADDEQKREILSELTLEASPTQVDTWMVRLLPQDWIRLHIVNKIEVVNGDETMRVLTDEMKDSRNGWKGILMGTWVELLTQLTGWLSRDYERYGRGVGNSVAADWIESVLIFYESQLKFSRMPTDEERRRRSEERLSSYTPTTTNYRIKLSQAMRDVGRTIVAELDEEEVMKEEEENLREKEEREAFLRTEHPDWSKEELEKALEEVKDADGIAEEEGFLAPMAIPYMDALMTGLDYGEQGDLDDNDEGNMEE